MSAHFEFRVSSLEFRVIKIIFVFFLFCILHSAFLIPAHAQEASASSLSTTNSELPTTLPLPSYIPPTSPAYMDLMVFNIFHTFSCIAVGSSSIGQPCLTYQNGIPLLSKANLDGGVLGATGSILTALYANPPVRTGDYLASLGEGLGIVKEANAQGVTGSGADVLRPILSLWQVSRNITYVIMIILFVIIGIMVMFRQKINPQTVITAQSALPGLVIGLVMITFSYFLAALISDVAFIGTNLVGYYFSLAQNTKQEPLTAVIEEKNILEIYSPFVSVIKQKDLEHAFNTVFDNVSKEVQDFLRLAASAIAFQYGEQIGHAVPGVGDLVAIITGLIAAGVAASAASSIFGLFLSWIVMVIMIYTMLKLLIRLLNSYLQIVFLTISAPFHFLLASLPGRQEMATAWMLNMLCNILAFPAVLGVLYFVSYMVNFSNRREGFFGASDLGVFVNNGASTLVGPSTLPLLGHLDSHFINTLLAFAALLALPAIPDVICKVVGKESQAGALLAGAVSGNLRGGQGYANQGTQIKQAISKGAQNYQTFRGHPPNYSPAKAYEAGWKVGGKQIIKPSTLPEILSPRKGNV